MIHTPRPMQDADLAPLAQVWHDSWHRAHDAFVPEALIKQRTVQAFADRLPGLKDKLRVIGSVTTPSGLCCTEDDELNQMFVTVTAQGTGMAQALMADGEARIAALGHKSAWLKVVVENGRAVAFYRKLGWIETGRKPIHFGSAASSSPVEVLIFRKPVTI